MTDEACTCRKPAPGLYQQVAERYGVSLKGVPAAGDSVWDAQAAYAAGCAPHLLLTGNSEMCRNGPLPPDLPPGTCVHTDLQAFADAILNEKNLLSGLIDA